MLRKWKGTDWGEYICNTFIYQRTCIQGSLVYVLSWRHPVNNKQDLKSPFLKEDIQMAKKRGSMSLVIGEMKNKSTVRSHYTPIGWWKLKDNAKCW